MEVEEVSGVSDNIPDHMIGDFFELSWRKMVGEHIFVETMNCGLAIKIDVHHCVVWRDYKAVRRAYISARVKEDQLASEALKVNRPLSGCKLIQLNPILQLFVQGPIKEPSV